MRPNLVEPRTAQILAYCARRPGRARVPRGRRAARERSFRRARRPRRRPTGRLSPRHQRRALRKRVRRVRRDRRARRAAHADRRAGRRHRALGGGAAAARAAARGSPRAARLRLDDPTRARGNGVASGDACRPRRARAGVREGPLRGARRGSAATRPERVPLADARADRGRPLLALAREGRDPLQGGGVGLDPERCPAPAGVGRPARASPGQRGAGASRPDPAIARRGAGRVPLRARREHARDPALRGRRDGARARLPERALLEGGATCSLRHAARALERLRPPSASTPPARGGLCRGRGVERGARPARGARRRAGAPSAVATRLVRTQETLEVALADREVERIVVPGLDEIGFGAYEGGSASPTYPGVGVDTRAGRCLARRG